MKRSLRRLVNLMLLAGSSSALPFGVDAYTTVADSTKGISFPQWFRSQVKIDLYFSVF